MGSKPSNQKNKPMLGIELYIDNYICGKIKSQSLAMTYLHRRKINCSGHRKRQIQIL
jgi:hypothetical protein